MTTASETFGLYVVKGDRKVLLNVAWSYERALDRAALYTDMAIVILPVGEA